MKHRPRVSAFTGELFLALLLLAYGLSLPLWISGVLALLAGGLLLAKHFGLKVYLK